MASCGGAFTDRLVSISAKACVPPCNLLPKDSGLLLRVFSGEDAFHFSTGIGTQPRVVSIIVTKGAIDPLPLRMAAALRDRDRGVSRDTNQRKGIAATFRETSQRRVPDGVGQEYAGQIEVLARERLRHYLETLKLSADARVFHPEENLDPRQPYQ